MKASDLSLHPVLQGENGAWKRIQGTWQLLHGSFPEMGLSIEWHDFRIEQDMDWGRSFHPGSLEICLNFSGNAVIQEGGTPSAPWGRTRYPLHLAGRQGAGPPQRGFPAPLLDAWNSPPEFLRTHFGDELEQLKPPVREFIEQGAKAPPTWR